MQNLLFRFFFIYNFATVICFLFLSGVCYREGSGVAKKNSEAKKYLKLAADQGHAGAAKELKTFWF